ncbi:hypothetical protein C0993_000998 [Termitomyces sp. T159_Od127]|nr:hypothetical protein C0993_000998 [Termitomyces sp. T159_Od127]
MSELAFLQTQIGLLEEELADVKRERNAFRQELSYYREKAAKYISLADEHNSTIRDLERELERTQKLAKMSEVLGNAPKTSEASKKNELIRQGITDVAYSSVNRQTSEFQVIISGIRCSVYLNTALEPSGFSGDAVLAPGNR